MPSTWKSAAKNAWTGLLSFMLAVLAFAFGQVLIALALWPILFRTQRVGFSMALSLVGFGSWAVSFFASMGDRRRRRLVQSAPKNIPPPFLDRPVMGRIQAQIQGAGCGLVLLAASLIPLGIALILRLRADLETGLTLRDIFPPVP
jgi:hypothetical protein